MLIKEYMQLAREEIVNVEYNMIKLVDLAWGREVHLDLDLNKELMEGIDVGWPTNTNSQASSSLWVCPISIKFSSVAFIGVICCRLNKMLISKINKHH